MTRFLWMTDPHFQNTGTIAGLDPRARLTAALTHANTHYADAEFIVLTGDLIGDDIDADYRQLAQVLAGSRLPVHPLMGNNDNRDGLRRHLALPPGTQADFIQYALPTAQGTVLCLDSHQIGSHAGELCKARLDWLSQQLLSAPGPVYVALHHPPQALGLPMQDEIKLKQGDALLDLLAAHPHVRHLFMGHVHRPTCGTMRGIPFATLGALSFQAPAPRPEWDWTGFTPAPEPPHYAVVQINEGDVTVQFIQFCDAGYGMQQG